MPYHIQITSNQCMNNLIWPQFEEKNKLNFKPVFCKEYFFK